MTQDQDRIDAMVDEAERLAIAKLVAMKKICAGMTLEELRDAPFTYQSLLQIVQRREEKKEQPK